MTTLISGIIHDEALHRLIQFARRASAILFHLLRGRADSRPYLLPANICSIVPATFLESRSRYELIDVEEPWLTMDQQLCIARLQERPHAYAGVIYVRSYGNDHDPSPFFERLRSIQPDLFLIDDHCLCRPDPDGLSLAPLADATLFSTGRAKYVDLGEGGFAHLRPSIHYDRHVESFDPHALVEVERRLKTSIETSSVFQGNVAGWLDLRQPEYSWNEYQRTIKIQRAASDAQKKRINAIYEEMLPREIQAPPEMQHWRFNIRVAHPGRLLEALFAAGLFASRHYAPVSPVLGGDPFPVAEAAHASIVNLFNDRYFDEERALRAVELILRHLDK